MLVACLPMRMKHQRMLPTILSRSRNQAVDTLRFIWILTINNNAIIIKTNLSYLAVWRQQEIKSDFIKKKMDE